MKYLIIGGTGSLGKKLIDRLTFEGHELYIYSRDESKHWTLKNQLKNDGIKNVEFIIGDVRNRSRVQWAIDTYLPQVVLIAAALKQVDTCEANPSESIATNLLGTQNVVDAVNSARHVPGRVLFVSTDKSASPSNVYGMCKALSERVVTSQKYRSVASSRGTRWLCTRYGNVLQSRGSIIPLFKYQVENCNEITVTNPNMTRFVMTLDQSVDLIEEALQRGSNGETWIPILPSMRIGDLAEIFSERYDRPIKIIGMRPGEKVHEDLVTETEAARTRLNDDGRHYVIRAALDPQDGFCVQYSSRSNLLTKDQLLEKLKVLKMIDAPLDQFIGQSIEEIRR